LWPTALLLDVQNQSPAIHVHQFSEADLETPIQDRILQTRGSSGGYRKMCVG